MRASGYCSCRPSGPGCMPKEAKAGAVTSKGWKLESRSDNKQLTQTTVKQVAKECRGSPHGSHLNLLYVICPKRSPRFSFDVSSRRAMQHDELHPAWPEDSHEPCQPRHCQVSNHHSRRLLRDVCCTVGHWFQLLIMSVRRALFKVRKLGTRGPRTLSLNARTASLRIGSPLRVPSKASIRVPFKGSRVTVRIPYYKGWCSGKISVGHGALQSSAASRVSGLPLSAALGEVIHKLGKPTCQAEDIEPKGLRWLPLIVESPRQSPNARRLTAAVVLLREVR